MSVVIAIPSAAAVALQHGLFREQRLGASGDDFVLRREPCVYEIAGIHWRAGTYLAPRELTSVRLHISPRLALRPDHRRRGHHHAARRTPHREVRNQVDPGREVRPCGSGIKKTASLN